MNWSEADRKAHEATRPELYGKHPKVDESGLLIPPKVKVAGVSSVKLNKTEWRFHAHLEMLKKIGEISDFRVQAWTFKLAADCRFTPDFAVLRKWEAPNDIWVNEWTLFDVKGRKKKPSGEETFHSEEDARIKIRVAATLWPWFRWCIVFPKSNGEWEEVEFHA